MIGLLLAGCGPDLQPILKPEAPFLVHVYTSADGERWTPRPGPVAGRFSSLGAVVHEGALLVSGLPATPPGWWEERFPQLFVAVLASTDLDVWTVRRFDVDAPGTSLIDPQLVAGPDGLELWFVQADGLGDPGEGARETRLIRSYNVGSAEAPRFGRAETWHVGRGLVDVAPVWFRGSLTVFATRAHSEVVRIVGAPGNTVETRVAGGITVPFPVVVGSVPPAGGAPAGTSATGTSPGDAERLWLWAQAPVDGGMRPVRLDSQDGINFGAPQALVRDPGVTSCASPVVTAFARGWTLVCVEEPARPPGPPR